MNEDAQAERTVEDRLAALEAALFAPPLPPLTDEQVEEFKAKWAEAVEHHAVERIPPKPLLTPELASELSGTRATGSSPLTASTLPGSRDGRGKPRRRAVRLAPGRG